MAALVATPSRADYGLDAPGLVRFFLIGGPLLLISGLILERLGGGLTVLGRTLLITGCICAAEGLLMWWSSRVGKLRLRNQRLDDLRLNGAEHVLDVGCGRGLLLIGAAHRLPHGHATGVDLWSQQDLSANARSATLANAAAEDVGERVTVVDGDMRQLPFPDASFDAVVANLSIHNIPDAAGRTQAIREIARVLRPGGQVSLTDFRYTRAYAADLRAVGLPDARISNLSFLIFPPVRTVTGTRAA